MERIYTNINIPIYDNTNEKNFKDNKNDTNNLVDTKTSLDILNEIFAKTALSSELKSKEGFTYFNTSLIELQRKMAGKLNVIFFGDTCAGKTSSINSLLQFYLGKTVKQNYLPQSSYENTYYITTIEESKGNSIGLDVNGKEFKTFSNDEEGFKQLKDFLKELDKDSLEILRQIKTNEKSKTDIENIKIRIPGLPQWYA
jgi:predicted GTPase